MLYRRMAPPISLTTSGGKQTYAFSCRYRLLRAASIPTLGREGKTAGLGTSAGQEIGIGRSETIALEVSGSFW